MKDNTLLILAGGVLAFFLLKDSFKGVAQATEGLGKGISTASAGLGGGISTIGTEIGETFKAPADFFQSAFSLFTAGLDSVKKNIETSTTERSRTTSSRSRDKSKQDISIFQAKKTYNAPDVKDYTYDSSSGTLLNTKTGLGYSTAFPNQTISSISRAVNINKPSSNIFNKKPFT